LKTVFPCEDRFLDQAKRPASACKDGSLGSGRPSRIRRIEWDHFHDQPSAIFASFRHNTVKYTRRLPQFYSFRMDCRRRSKAGLRTDVPSVSRIARGSRLTCGSSSDELSFKRYGVSGGSKHASRCGSGSALCLCGSFVLAWYVARESSVTRSVEGHHHTPSSWLCGRRMWVMFVARWVEETLTTVRTRKMEAVLRPPL